MGWPPRTSRTAVPHVGAGRHRGNDALRGLAILAVVASHTTAEWAAFPAGHPLTALYRAVRPALDVWIPLFLLVSGYYLGREDVDSMATYGRYLSRRARRILPPYLLWATILFAVGVAGGEWRVSDFPAGIVNGRFAYPHYFVSVLVKLYLAFPVFSWALKTPARAASLFVGAGGLWFYGCLPDDSLGLRSTFLVELLFRRTVHAEWAIFFILGIFLQHRACKTPRSAAAPNRGPGMAVAGLGLMFSVVGLVDSGRVLPGHIVGVLGVLLFLAINSNPGERFAARGRLLAGLGVQSYSIYLLHEPWLQWTKNALGAVVNERPILVQVPLVAAALGIPLAFRWLANLFPGSRTTWATG